MENAFAKSAGEVLDILGVIQATGLTDAQVESQRAKHGRNCRSILIPLSLHSVQSLSLFFLSYPRVMVLGN